MSYKSVLNSFREDKYARSDFIFMKNLRNSINKFTQDGETVQPEFGKSNQKKKGDGNESDEVDS